MTINTMVAKWEDLKEKVVYSHKPNSYILQSALASFGLDKELSEQEQQHKTMLVTIENKWDSKFNGWLLEVEYDKDRWTKQQLEKILNNFTNRFHADIIKTFPIKEFITDEA